MRKDNLPIKQKLLDQIEDYELARIAKQREKKSFRKDYVKIEQALEKVIKDK